MARRRRRARKPRRSITRYVRSARRRSKRTGSYTTPKQKLQLGIGAAAAGFVLNNVAGISAQIEKLPKLANFTLTGGIALAVLNRFVKNKWLDIAATGAIAAGAFELGKAKFSLRGIGHEDEDSSGWDGAVTEDEIRGVISDTDVIEPDVVDADAE